MLEQQKNITEFGRVESVINEICLITGLQSVALNNVVEFSSGQKGLVLSFSKDEVQAIIFGDYHNIKKGDIVKIVADNLQINFSESLLGRIINPLGEPLDGKGKIEKGIPRDLEGRSKKVNERRQIDKSLSTGYLIIDSQIPIGVGQRELFVGEKRVRKSDVTAAIIGNQTLIKSNVISIFVSIDAGSTGVKRRIKQVTGYGALKNSIFIIARSSDPASLNYIAPMAGIAIAEGFAEKGLDVVVIFDNLTRHAKIYRQISLLLNRPPGREAYPGDVFYLHSRLLERCGCFSEKVGGGSITAFPVVETQSEEITDYITTNLMSITDGHILFRQSLANKGIQPAIDSGFSVSRIGGRAQKKVIRKLSDKLKSIIIRYHEVEKYIAFGSEVNQETLETIELGKRIYQIFNQTVSELFTYEQEVAILALVISKKILSWDVEQMHELRQQLVLYVKENPQRLKEIIEVEYTDNTESQIDDYISGFISLPTTLKPKIKEAATEAEKETIIDVLKGNPQDAIIGNLKK